MKNPTWHKDEIILALELYFSPDRGSIDSKNPKIIELSKLLNQLPLFEDRPDAERFRNKNGVALKLANFQAFDVSYTGKGMSRGSKLDKELVEYFQFRIPELNSVAAEIKEMASNRKVVEKLRDVENENIEGFSVWEGSSIYRLHKAIERDQKIIKLKKVNTLKETGKLSCEACGFDFKETYGERGDGFIECHHRSPLHKLKSKVQTRLNDLALVCSNCHRMLHRDLGSISVEILKSDLAGKRTI